MNVQDSITIVVASDDNYAVLLAALIKSIEANHKSAEKLELYIIDDGISESTRKKIIASSSPSMTTLHWFPAHDLLPADTRIPIDRSSFPITASLRLFAPDIIPPETKKMIYLDTDMIMLEDISTLWHTDLQGKMLAAVKDLAEVVSCEWAGIQNFRELGIPGDSPYFNSGMLIIDPLKWRQNNIAVKVLHTIQENVSFASFPDQYGLNVVFANQWISLDQRWNCYSNLAIEDPYIIHYTKIKPIFRNYDGNEKYRLEFYKYLGLTAWKNFKPLGSYVRIYWKLRSKLRKIIKGYL